VGKLANDLRKIRQIYACALSILCDVQITVISEVYQKRKKAFDKGKFTKELYSLYIASAS
jgi:hypothetical protein